MLFLDCSSPITGSMKFLNEYNPGYVTLTEYGKYIFFVNFGDSPVK